MFQKLVSRNDDIRRLVEKGYAVGFDSNCLIVRGIPYLDDKGALAWGAFVTVLVFEDSDKVSQQDHQVFFAGSHPHELDGKPIANLGGGPTGYALSSGASDAVVQRQFSNKPRENGQLVPFRDLFAKIESYTSIIAGPAMAKYKEKANPLTYRIVEEVATDPIFKVRDTLTSRAEIGDLTAAMKNDHIALIGLGGSGAYALDYLVKTPVRTIRGFDHDRYYVHNAFRSPGALEEDEFRQPKAEVYQARYENFRHGLNLQTKLIDESSEADLAGVTFAFVCVDKGSARAAIFALLLRLKIPFVDVGMSLRRKHGPINGTMRATYYSAEEGTQRRDEGYANLADPPENIYRTNIQIAELNALNAAIAVIKFKQLRGFYQADLSPFHLLYEIADSSLTSRVVSADEA